MRLKAKSIPNPLHSGPGDGGFFCHGAGAPVGAAPGFCLKGLANQFCHLFVRYGPRSPRTQFIMKTADSLFQEPPAPKAHRLRAVIELPGDIFVGCPFSRHDNDLGPRHQTVRKGAGAGD